MKSWGSALKQKSSMAALVYSVAVLTIFILYLPYFFNEVIAPKPGVSLNDFILRHLVAIDCSWIIFILIYACLLQTIITNARSPDVILLGLVTYCSVSLMRLLTIYLFTLEPPANLVPLSDPFVSLIAYESSFTKDLFYSGHVSTLAVLVMIEPRKIFRYLKLISTLGVSILLLLQHVHYTIDVLIAPVIAFLILRIMAKLFSLPIPNYA